MFRHAPESRQDGQIGKPGGLLERAHLSGGVFLSPLLHIGFLRVARAEHDLMAMFQEATRQYLSNNSGT